MATMASVIPSKRLLMLQRVNTQFFYRVQGLGPVKSIRTREGVVSKDEVEAWNRPGNG